MNAWFEKLYETFIETGYYKLVIEGLGNTVIITLGALCIGVLIGTFIAVTKYFAEDAPVLKPLALLCDAYVTAIRGIPVVVLLLIFYFIILKASDGVTVGILTFGINSGAYMAELIRSGINAVDKGQMEAGRSLGMSKLQTMGKVIFPQAARQILPIYKGEFISMVKMTSVVGYIAVQDLTKASDIIRSRTYEAFFPLIVTAVIYFILAWALTSLLSLIEIRIDPRKRSREVKGVTEA